MVARKLSIRLMVIFILEAGFLLLNVSVALAKDVAEMELEELALVKVFSFDVSSQLDSGYRASNSVSGSRFDAPIRNLPFAIQAFTESFIKDQKPITIFDVAKYSPGVTYRSNDFNEGNANLAIRGFAVSATPGNIQILRDGFHGPSIFDFTNISRVEVVKGPASFLYGQLSPGGIVNIITKSPQPQLAATADASYGSYGEYRVEADVTGPATTGLYYRFASSYFQDVHYWDAYDAHSIDLSPSLLWRPYERLSVTLKYEYFNKNEEPQLMQKPGYASQVGAIPSVSDPNRSGVDVPGLADNWNGVSYSDFRHSSTSALSTWIDFRPNENWDVRTSYSHQDYKVNALYSGNFGMANNTTLLQGRRLRGQIYTNEGDSYEIQGVGKYTLGDTSLRLLLGSQYINRRFDNWAAQAPNDPALGNNPTASPLPLWNLRDPSTWNRYLSSLLHTLTENRTDQIIKYEDKSVYAGTTFGFMDDQLLVLAGQRLTLTESQLTNHVTNIAEGTVTAHAITPQYGVLYKVTPELSVFASYAESFVPGVQKLRNPDGSTKSSVPTKGRGYDIGLKSEMFNGRASSTLTIFDVRNKNIVNDIANTNNVGSVVITNVQSGEQRSQGVELDTTVTLTDEWQFYFSYSYIFARITEFSGNDAFILAQNPSTLDAAGVANYKNVKLFHNAPLQMSAPHLANLWMRYDFKREGPRNVYVAGGFNFVHDQTLLPDGPELSHQNYTLLNAMLGYKWMWQTYRMSTDLMVKNITDEYYRPSQSTRGRPREFLLTLSSRF